MLELLDSPAILIDNIEYYISKIMQGEIIFKDYKKDLQIVYLEGWDIRAILGNKEFPKFRDLIESYKGDIQIEKITEFTWILVATKEVKEYTISNESLEELEKEMKVGEPSIAYKVRANKYEIKGWKMDGSKKNMYFTIYNKLKELDASFKKHICKVKDEWWLTESITKISYDDLDEESKSKINSRKQRLIDLKNRIIWVDGSRYKLMDGVDPAEAESTANLANIPWVIAGGGYLTDGMTYECGNVISVYDDESDKLTIYAKLID